MKFKEDFMYTNEEYTLEKGDSFLIKKNEEGKAEIFINDKHINYIKDIKISTGESADIKVYLQRFITTKEIEEMKRRLYK